MAKWVVCALRANGSNLKFLLQYCITTTRPNKLFRWGRDLKWAFVDKFVIGMVSKYGGMS
jgi:hypothetical protein